jgi:hypothetical protein
VGADSLTDEPGGRRTTREGRGGDERFGEVLALAAADRVVAGPFDFFRDRGILLLL